MAQKLRLVDEKKEDKKNKGLRLVDSPSTPNPLPSAPKTPSPFTPNEESAPRVQTIKLVDDPSQTIFAEDQKVDLLRSKVIENFDQRLERFYSKGEYPSVDNESLDKYLDAKYGDVWHDDFWAKARRGGGTAWDMVVEDLFVGLFYEGPKQGALTEMQGAVDGLVRNKIKNLKLKKEYGKLIGPVTRQSLRSPFSGRTGSSADILQRLTSVEERRLNAIHNAMKSLMPLEKTLSGENPTKEKMDLFKKIVVAVNRRSAVDAKSIVPEGSDLKRVALKSSGDLFEDGSSKVDDILTMAKFALKIAHPLGTPLKSTATTTEAVARGGADIGMIGNMIANNVFDNTQKYQDQVNRHINTKLKEYWSERNLEYEPKISEFNYGRLKPNLDGITGAQVEEWLKEIPGAHNKLKEARRDQWNLMQVLITDRERARRGMEPIVSQYSRNLGADRVADWYAENVNSRMAEGLSYGLDPVTIGTMGYGAIGKQVAMGVTRGALRRIASSAVIKSGGALEGVGGAISKTASGIDEVAGEGVAGGIIGTGVGLATEAPLPGSVVAGVAGGKVLQPVQKLATVGEAVSATGQTLRATGEILSSAPGSEGFMRRMSISSTAPKRVANLAARLEILDPAITLAADITKGTATGTAIGVGLTAATGEGTEMVASGAVTGGVLGGLTVLPLKLVTPDAEIKRAADVNAWLERQPEPIREILKTRPFKDQQAAAELDLFARGFGAYEGKADVPIEYYFATDKNEGAYLINEGRIKINLNYDGPRTLAHEIGHAIKGLAMADAEGGPMRTAYEKIRGLIFDRTIGDSTVKGIYSIDDEVVFAKQYLSRMRESRTPEQYQQWASENGFDFGTAELTKEGYQSSEKARSVVQGEIEAETFANFIQGKGPGAITGAGSAKSRLLNHIMLSEHSKTLSGMRYVLENVFKVRFDSDGGVSKMFIKDGKGITNSPKVNAAIEEFVAARRAIRERISPESEGESTAQVFTLDEVKNDPGMVEYFAAHDAFARNDDGDIVVVNGKPVILNKTEIGKLQRNRVKEITKALESVDEIGGLQVSTTKSGKKRWSGKNFSKEQLDALLALPDDVFSPRLKENLQFIYDKINEGSSIHYDYNAATTLGKYSSQISAAWRHDMPFSIEITQAGNFLVKGVNVDRINAKIAKWKSDKKGRYLDLWDNNFKDFYTNLMQYMANHREGKRGADGLSPDPVLAKRRAERINELFGVSGSEANRAETIGGKVKRGAESSRRFDRINQLRSGDGDWSVDYNSLRQNFMPAGKKKGLPPDVGEVSKGYKGKRTLGKLGRATERNKELQDLAQNVDQMSQAEWNAAVERLDPIIPTPDSKIPNPSMFKAMDRSLKALDKNGKPFVMDVSQYKNIRNPAPGSNVKKVRIDISAMERAMEAYSRDDIETPLHPVAFYDENGIGYASHLYIKDGTFSYPGNIQPRILETSQGRSKDTFIFTEGEVIGGPLPSRAELMRVNNKGERVWTEAGVNPLRHGYAYDKNNPSIKIHGGDRMLLANNSVWVRNARKVEAVKVPGLRRMGSGEFEGPEVRYMPAGKGVEVAPGRVRAEDGAEFNLSKPILAQFMPAKKVQLEDYKDRAIFALAADNLAVGDLEVGPTGAKAPIDVPAQGGRGFQFLDPDNMIWAFTDESAAKRLIKRGLDVSGGKNTVIMGVTSQGSTTHFNSAYGLNGFVRNLEAGVESGTFSSKRMNQYVKDLMGLVAKSESKDFTPQQRKIISGIKGLRGLRRAVESKKINFATAGMIKDKFTNIGKMKNSKLEIIQPELVEAGMDLSSLMRDMSDPELRDAKIGDVVALVELNLTKRPRKTDFHYSYPWTVEGKPIGFLKEFHNVRDLTSSTKIYQGKGKAKLKKNIGPQPLQTVMPVFDKLGTYFMPAGKGGDIFYSNSSKALESPKVRNSATGAAMLNDIIRQDPAARQEMKWIDLDRWLMDKKGKVTKEEVQDFIDANQIAVVEKVRGGEDPPELRAAEEAVEDARQAMYDADDRGTFQEARDAEMAFEEAVSNLEFVSKDFDPQFNASNLVLPGAKKGSYRELELMFPKRKGEQFKDSHFETDENVFAHVRFNERVDADGKRMLFIEELQGDWAASGRERGFNEPYINGDVVGGREESVPAAPFVSKQKGNRFVEDDKWRALAMKRMIRWGADNGYDRVGWVTGRDTADRYNLSKFIDRVEYQRLPGEDRTMVSAWDKAGNKIIPDRMVASKDMKRTVGRDLAEQIAADKSGSGEFEGLELAVGGEGHKQFYDIDLPNYTGKYVKKWGGKVGMVDVSLRAAEDVEALKGIPERTTKAHYVDITPQMKADVQQGQAMFMPAGSDASYMKAAKKGDTKGAQLLVDKAAKAAGYTIGPVYHGTQRDFTTFDKGRGMTGKLSAHPIAKYGFFFAPEKSTAEVYSGKDGKVMDAYLKIERLYKADMYGKEIIQLADDRGVAVDTKVGPWIKGLIEKGYDGIELSLFGKPHEIMVFDPNQIKSADPITYDDAGNIIPLSERFQPSSDDIRYMPAGGEVTVYRGTTSGRKVSDRHGGFHFAAMDKKQAEAYALGDSNGVRQEKINLDKILSEEEARNVMREIGIAPKDYEFSALVDKQYASSAFLDSFIGKANLEKFRDKLIKRGKLGVRFADFDATDSGSKRPTKESLFLLNTRN